MCRKAMNTPAIITKNEEDTTQKSINSLSVSFVYYIYSIIYMSLGVSMSYFNSLESLADKIKKTLIFVIT